MQQTIPPVQPSLDLPPAHADTSAGRHPIARNQPTGSDEEVEVSNVADPGRRRALLSHLDQNDGGWDSSVGGSIVDLVLQTEYSSLYEDVTMFRVGSEYALQVTAADGRWVPSWHLLEEPILEWANGRQSDSSVRSFDLIALRRLRIALNNGGAAMPPVGGNRYTPRHEHAGGLHVRIRHCSVPPADSHDSRVA
jgi:hypothetical protein